MAENLTRKIIRSHLAQPSEMRPGDEIYLKFDQTLPHDINAVMCYLAFEGIGIPRVKTEASVSYLDHNLLYVDSKPPPMTTSFCRPWPSTMVSICPVRAAALCTLSSLPASVHQARPA